MTEELKDETRGVKQPDDEPELDMEPVSMYQLFSRFFVEVTKVVQEEVGEERGEELIREAVRRFGEKRGANIAARAAENGKPNTLAYYLRYYDMERTNQCVSDNYYKENEIEQDFNHCVFAREFRDMDAEKIGLMYCQEIDPAIAHGYNENLKCVHDKHFFTDGMCHFRFFMEEGAGSEEDPEK